MNTLKIRCASTGEPGDTPPTPSLYEADFLEWIELQVTLLRDRQFDRVDFDNVIEELSSMGRSQRRALQSRLETLIAHLLKCQFQPDRKSASWLGTLIEQRSKIQRTLEDSPSLARAVEQYAVKVYPTALRRAVNETGLPSALFPTENPYSVADLLNMDYVP